MTQSSKLAGRPPTHGGWAWGWGAREAAAEAGVWQLQQLSWEGREAADGAGDEKQQQLAWRQKGLKGWMSGEHAGVLEQQQQADLHGQHLLRPEQLQNAF